MLPDTVLSLNVMAAPHTMLLREHSGVGAAPTFCLLWGSPHLEVKPVPPERGLTFQWASPHLVLSVITAFYIWGN